MGCGTASEVSEVVAKRTQEGERRNQDEAVSFALRGEHKVTRETQLELTFFCMGLVATVGTNLACLLKSKDPRQETSIQQR